MGFDSVFSQNVSGTIALNMSPNQYLDDSQVFVPTFKVGVRVLDVFSTKEKLKPQKPLPIDASSFMLMEKGLLEYTLFCQRVGFSDEQIKLAKDVPAEERPYFSLLIIRKDYPCTISV